MKGVGGSVLLGLEMLGIVVLYVMAEAISCILVLGVLIPIGVVVITVLASCYVLARGVVVLLAVNRKA